MGGGVDLIKHLPSTPNHLGLAQFFGGIITSPGELVTQSQLLSDNNEINGELEIPNVFWQIITDLKDFIVLYLSQPSLSSSKLLESLILSWSRFFNSNHIYLSGILIGDEGSSMRVVTEENENGCGQKTSIEVKTCSGKKVSLPSVTTQIIHDPNQISQRVNHQYRPSIAKLKVGLLMDSCSRGLKSLFPIIQDEDDMYDSFSLHRNWALPISASSRMSQVGLPVGYGNITRRNVVYQKKDFGIATNSLFENFFRESRGESSNFLLDNIFRALLLYAGVMREYEGHHDDFRNTGARAPLALHRRKWLWYLAGSNVYFSSLKSVPTLDSISASLSVVDILEVDAQEVESFDLGSEDLTLESLEAKSFG
ncbi:hypothetical protein Tco_0270507 [Tanacetum coccineum]